LSQVFSRGPVALLEGIAAYAVTFVIAAIVAVVLLGLWNSVAGRSENTSQMGMRIRVVLQFIIICAAMAILYLSAR
jgi:anaerobic C4-dicarboxylate transporter